MGEAYIFDAVRTPRGKGRPAKNDRPGGALASTPPHELVVGLIDALEARNSGMTEHIESLTLGCVGQVNAQGGHIALVSRLASTLPDAVAVKSVNNYCVSGLTAVIDGAVRVQAGHSNMVLAGGVESLSHVPFLADNATYFTDPKLIQDLNYAPPIMGAELVATLEGFTKANLDALTYRSHQRAAKAWDEGRYAPSVIPVTSKDGTVLFTQDELIRADMTEDRLSKMPPAFAAQGARGFDAMMLARHPEISEINHIHSIANCPGMADGASLILMGREAEGQALGLTLKARIVDFIEMGADPVLQLTAGLAAMEVLLTRQNLKVSDIDRIEFMEAFAAIPLKFLQDYDVDPERVNVNGGHLAMGHPMGATGGILLTTLVHELERCGGRLGLVVAQAGSGIGAAMLIERV